MIIRPEQLEAFSQARYDAFVRRMVAHLQQDFAKELAENQVPPGQLEDQVRQAIQEAEAYGVEDEDDLRFYLECMAILGPQFDKRYDWAHEILTREDLDASEKMTELNDYMIFGLEEPK